MILKEKILKKLIQKLLRRVFDTYEKKYNARMPVVLITGTVGKSSQTLMISQLFERAGYRVLTGTKPERGMNSLAGIGMVLLGKEANLEGKSALVKISFMISFWWSLLWAGFFKKFDYPLKTAFVYEVGFDHQNEYHLFKDLFKAGMLVVTNLTWEHSAGFEDIWRKEDFDSIKNLLPTSLINSFTSKSVNNRLKNIALEQLMLATDSDYLILPSTIGKIENDLETNAIGNKWEEHKVHTQRNPDGSLSVGDLNLSGAKYMLPLTFGKFFQVCNIIAATFNLGNNAFESMVESMILPQGRFNLLKGVNNTTIVDSSYNSDPDSLTSFLKSFEEIIKLQSSVEWLEKEGLVMPPRHTLILGEMRELGDMAIQDHTDILEKVAALQSRYYDRLSEIILIGKEWLKCNQDGITKKDNNYNLIVHNKNIFKVFLRSGDILSYLNEDRIRVNQWFWVKGSQNTIFLEVVVEGLLSVPADSKYLCRRGEEWDNVRKNYK
jgi:hypothetical protein